MKPFAQIYSILLFYIVCISSKQHFLSSHDVPHKYWPLPNERMINHRIIYVDPWRKKQKQKQNNLKSFFHCGIYLKAHPKQNWLFPSSISKPFAFFFFPFYHATWTRKYSVFFLHHKRKSITSIFGALWIVGITLLTSCQHFRWICCVPTCVNDNAV